MRYMTRALIVLVTLVGSAGAFADSVQNPLVLEAQLKFASSVQVPDSEDLPLQSSWPDERVHGEVDQAWSSPVFFSQMISMRYLKKTLPAMLYGPRESGYVGSYDIVPAPEGQKETRLDPAMEVARNIVVGADAFLAHTVVGRLDGALEGTDFERINLNPMVPNAGGSNYTDPGGIVANAGQNIRTYFGSAFAGGGTGSEGREPYYPYYPPIVIPEPLTVTALGIGAVALLGTRRRKLRVA